MNINSLSHSARTILLAYIAHQLTISARSTYEFGTEDIKEPTVLRAYNELMHQVTSSLRSHIENEEGMPLEAVLETMNNFAVTFNKAKEIDWVIQSSQEFSSVTNMH